MDPVTGTAPEATPAATTTEPAGDSPGFDFGALAAHDDSAPLEPVVSGAVEPPAVASAPSASSTSPPAGTSAQPPAVPPATPSVPAAAAAPPTPPEPAGTQPPVATETPATEAAPAVPELTIEQHKEKFLPQLAGMYKLSDAEVEELRINPGEALPKLAAQLHYNVQMAAYQGILSVLPQVIAQQMQSVEAQSGNERAFFDKWPALKSAVGSNPEARKVIVNAITSFRQLNPKASLEDTIAHAGLLAMMSLKLPVTLPGAAPAANGGSPGGFSGAPPAPQMPPRPPGVGTTGHVPPASASGTDDSAGLINDIVNEHLAGNI